MKRLITLLCMVPLLATAQDTINGFEQVDGATAGKLFSNAKYFVSDAFTSSAAVTDLSDDQAKILMVKATIPVQINMPVVGKQPFNVYFKLTIQCSDGQYKYRADGFYLTYQPGRMVAASDYPLDGEKPKGMADKQWVSVKQQTADATTAMIRKLVETMAADNRL